MTASSVVHPLLRIYFAEIGLILGVAHTCGCVPVGLFVCLFVRTCGQGLLSAEAGMEYRTRVLQPGSSVDSIELLRSFLGRDPTPDSFLKSKGLEASSA